MKKQAKKHKNNNEELDTEEDNDYHSLMDRETVRQVRSSKAEGFFTEDSWEACDKSWWN